MNINKINNATRPQQRHNKKEDCCKTSQRMKCLLCNCCSYNFLFHSKLTPFHNKQQKIRDYGTHRDKTN
jgi:hypothetical protein